MKFYFLACMISRVVLKHCLDSSRHVLFQMQKTLGLYLHTCSRVLKNREGTITLFHLSFQKLKVPSISNVHWTPPHRELPQYHNVFHSGQHLNKRHMSAPFPLLIIPNPGALRNAAYKESFDFDLKLRMSPLPCNAMLKWEYEA